MEDIRVTINQHKTDKIRVEKVYAVFNKLTDVLQNLCSRVETLESVPAKQCSICCCSVPVVDVEPVPESAPVVPIDAPVETIELPTEVEVPVEHPASEEVVEQEDVNN